MNPQIVKYINEEMAIIVAVCCRCNTELFRCIMYEDKSPHKNFCINCIDKLEDKAWKYDEVCK